MFATYPIGTAPRQLDCPKCRTPMRLVIGSGVQVALTLQTNRVHDRAKTDDLAAYKRMRGRGTQPPHVNGSAQLEKRVDDQIDIDYGDLVAQGSKTEVKEKLEEAQMHKLGLT